LWGADQKKTFSTWTAQNFENFVGSLKFIQAIYKGELDLVIWQNKQLGNVVLAVLA
jgi:hypothetical protein